MALRDPNRDFLRHTLATIAYRAAKSERDAAPAFADVKRGDLRLLLSGATSSAGRPMPDGAQPAPGGWNRIQLVVDDIEAEAERLRDEGLVFRNEIVTGPGGSQVLVEDPSGNLVEVFQPAAG